MSGPTGGGFQAPVQAPVAPAASTQFRPGRKPCVSTCPSCGVTKMTTVTRSSASKEQFETDWLCSEHELHQLTWFLLCGHSITMILSLLGISSYVAAVNVIFTLLTCLCCIFCLPATSKYTHACGNWYVNSSSSACVRDSEGLFSQPVTNPYFTILANRSGFGVVPICNCQWKLHGRSGLHLRQVPQTVSRHYEYIDNDLLSLD